MKTSICKKQFNPPTSLFINTGISIPDYLGQQRQ
jgi:hypothetical protein